MKRSGLKPSSAPMQRTGFLRRGTRLVSKRKPLTKIQASARDQECTIRIPGGCNYRTDTTVLCHENGAGMGMKHPDTRAAYGCAACHDIVDGRAPRPAGITYELMRAYFKEAIAQTQRILKRKGLLQEARDDDKR